MKSRFGEIRKILGSAFWALLVDLLNEHWFIATATSTEIFFIRTLMTSCSFRDTDNQGAGYNESY